MCDVSKGPQKGSMHVQTQMANSNLTLIVSRGIVIMSVFGHSCWRDDLQGEVWHRGRTQRWLDLYVGPPFLKSSSSWGSGLRLRLRLPCSTCKKSGVGCYFPCWRLSSVGPVFSHLLHTHEHVPRRRHRDFGLFSYSRNIGVISPTFIVDRFMTGLAGTRNR